MSKRVKECLHQSTQIIEYISRTFIETTEHNIAKQYCHLGIVSPETVHIDSI